MILYLKKVFAQDENNSELKDLLEAILDMSIKKVEVKNPELPKDIMNSKLSVLDIFIKKNGGTETKLEQWLWLLSGREEKIKMAEKENVELKKASEILNKMNLTDSERELYEARELGIFFQKLSLTAAEEHGFEQGHKEGISSNKKELLKKLLNKNVSDEEILDLLDLSKEELEKMKLELKN